MAVSLKFDSIWVHVGNGQRGTYELFVMLALASVRLGALPQVFRNGLRAFWGLTAAYVLYGAFDAAFVRESLINVRLW